MSIQRLIDGRLTFRKFHDFFCHATYFLPIFILEICHFRNTEAIFTDKNLSKSLHFIVDLSRLAIFTTNYEALNNKSLCKCH